MKTKPSKYAYNSAYSSDLLKVMIVALLVTISLIGAANLFSTVVSMLLE